MTRWMTTNENLDKLSRLSLHELQSMPLEQSSFSGIDVRDCHTASKLSDASIASESNIKDINIGRGPQSLPSNESGVPPIAVSQTLKRSQAVGKEPPSLGESSEVVLRRGGQVTGSTAVPSWPIRHSIRVKSRTAAHASFESLQVATQAQDKKLQTHFNRTSSAHQRAKATMASIYANLEREKARIARLYGATFLSAQESVPDDTGHAADAAEKQNSTATPSSLIDNIVVTAESKLQEDTHKIVEPPADFADCVPEQCVRRRQHRSLPRQPRATSIRWRPSQFSSITDDTFRKPVLV